MKTNLKSKAISLRKQGFSLKEISEDLGIAKSTASLWLRDTVLSANAIKRIESRITKGQIKAAEIKREKTRKLFNEFQAKSDVLVGRTILNIDMIKIICSLIYWCEGGKYSDNFVQFTNSDPSLMGTFLQLLRQVFMVDEKKFRVCMHLHDYHNEKKQRQFWSMVTEVPESQFIKSYNKPNTGKRIRKGYQGCVQLRYYDAVVSRELLAIAKSFMNKLENK